MASSRLGARQRVGGPSAQCLSVSTAVISVLLQRLRAWEMGWESHCYRAIGTYVRPMYVTVAFTDLYINLLHMPVLSKFILSIQFTCAAKLLTILMNAKHNYRKK